MCSLSLSFFLSLSIAQSPLPTRHPTSSSSMGFWSTTNILRVAIGIGLGGGVLIAVTVFFLCKWYRHRATNGCGGSLDTSTSTNHSAECALREEAVEVPDSHSKKPKIKEEEVLADANTCNPLAGAYNESGYHPYTIAATRTDEADHEAVSTALPEAAHSHDSHPLPPLPPPPLSTRANSDPSMSRPKVRPFPEPLPLPRSASEGILLKRQNAPVASPTASKEHSETTQPEPRKPSNGGDGTTSPVKHRMQSWATYYGWGLGDDDNSNDDSVVSDNSSEDRVVLFSPLITDPASPPFSASSPSSAVPLSEPKRIVFPFPMLFDSDSDSSSEDPAHVSSTGAAANHVSPPHSISPPPAAPQPPSPHAKNDKGSDDNDDIAVFLFPPPSSSPPSSPPPHPPQRRLARPSQPALLLPSDRSSKNDVMDSVQRIGARQWLRHQLSDGEAVAVVTVLGEVRLDDDDED